MRYDRMMSLRVSSADRPLAADIRMRSVMAADIVMPSTALIFANRARPTTWPLTPVFLGGGLFVFDMP